MALSYKIEADGIDVTAGFNDRMVDLTVTDHDGMQADEFKVRLDDRDFRLKPPRKGAVLKVWMDDNRGGGLALMGAFEVKGRKRSFKKGEGRVMEIHGKSADLRKSLKKPRTGSYENTTYEGLANKVAARHGLTAKVSASIAKLKVDYEAQSEESDLHLTSRLARDVDAICKVSNGQLIIRSRDDLDMPPLMLRQTDFIDCSVSDDDRAQHSKTTAHHHNRGKARRDPETVENDEAAEYPDAPEFMLRHTFPDKERAQAAAKGKMRSLQRQEKKLHGVMSGDTSVMAGLPAIIAWGVELYDGDYVFKTVVHHMNKAGGMTTTVDTDKGKKKGAKK
jgi:uncharacterized protein